MSGNCNFRFEIYTAGTTENYGVLQVDNRLNGQLWSSVMNRSGTDFEVVAEEKKFPVHKYILAARSPVFADQFSKEPLNQDASKTMKIKSSRIGSMETFLKFIYTGELDSPVKDDQLMHLAKIFRVKTLESLCEAASYNIDESEIARLALQLRTPGSTQSLMEVKYKMPNLKKIYILYVLKKVIICLLFTLDRIPEKKSLRKRAHHTLNLPGM